MTMIDKQKLLEWLYEERCNAQRQLDVRDVGDSNWYEYRGRTAAFNYVIQYVNSLPDDEPLQVEPKFRVGDRVRMAKGLFENQTGKITDTSYSYEVKTDAGANILTGETYIELLPAEPAPSAKDIKVTFKLTGAEAFVESAKQLIEALEALEVEIDDKHDKNTN